MSYASVRIGDFHSHGYGIHARCRCGHQRSIKADWLVKHFGEDYQMGLAQRQTFAEKLRCTECGKKGFVNITIGKV